MPVTPLRHWSNSRAKRSRPSRSCRRPAARGREYIDRAFRDLAPVGQQIHQSVQKTKAQCERDVILDQCAELAVRRETPLLLETAKRKIGGGDRDLPRRFQHRARREGHAQTGMAHDLIDIFDVAVATANSRRDEPIHEFRIFFDVGDEIEHLSRRVGKMAALGVFEH
jgi:hypothetical protein